MGRTTYDWVHEHMRATGEPWSYAVPTWVVTDAQPARIDGADIRFAKGAVPPIHAALVDAAGGRDFWVVSGGDLAGQLADAGLLDQLVLSYAPVTLGAGRPLFPRRFRLELRDVARNRDFVCATYDVGGTGGAVGQDTIPTYLTSRYSLIPSLPPSRPKPEALTPPNGAAGLDTTPVLRPTIPDSRPSATRRARPRSRV